MISEQNVIKIIQDNMYRLCKRLKIDIERIEFYIVNNNHPSFEATLFKSMAASLCAGWSSYDRKTNTHEVCINTDVVMSKKEAFKTLVHELLHVRFFEYRKLANDTLKRSKEEENIISDFEDVIGNLLYKEYYSKR